MKFEKEYTCEWTEECEADSFEEAERIMDVKAESSDNGHGVNHGEITCEDENEKN